MGFLDFTYVKFQFATSGLNAIKVFLLTKRGNIFYRDGSARITYELITDCSQSSMAASSSASVVTVNRVGQVSTSSLSGTAVVLVTVHEEFGINQTAVVHVEVRAGSNIINPFLLQTKIFWKIV